MLAQHRLSGDAMMTVRRPGDCNFFTDPGCDISRPNKHFSETQLQVRKPAQCLHRAAAAAVSVGQLGAWQLGVTCDAQVSS